MPQPGSSGMKPVFGKAYGTQLSTISEPFTISPTGGSTESDQCPHSVVVMLGAPGPSLCWGLQPRCELLSDLLEDVTTDDAHAHDGRWDVSALDEITRYAKGSPGGAPLSCERSSVSPERGRDVSWLSPRSGGRQAKKNSNPPPYVGSGPGRLPLAGRYPESWSLEPRGGESEAIEEMQQLGQEEMRLPSVVLEVYNEEHNYSLPSEPDTESSQEPDRDIREEEKKKKKEGRKKEKDREELKEEKKLQSHTRPKKRRCCWEAFLNSKATMERAGERDKGGDDKRDKEKDGGNLIWGPTTLPSTMCLKEKTSTNGERCPRKARRTDASDLTPSPGKLQSLEEQLRSLSSALEGMTPVSDLPVTARARTRKERNKLASRGCRLKKKAQHEANKIRLWGLNQEYDGLLRAVLQIKELIRQRVETGEGDTGREIQGGRYREGDSERSSLRESLEDILKESAGPQVGGRGQAFVEKMLKSLPGKERQGESRRRRVNQP